MLIPVMEIRIFEISVPISLMFCNIHTTFLIIEENLVNKKTYSTLPGVKIVAKIVTSGTDFVTKIVVLVFKNTH